uniref:Putative F-box/FBD/LRR-repeat protein n=1 Tax=Noccaea caerulescens TaxID=107243 RepID=A0A1J3G585_NOCCA
MDRGTQLNVETFTIAVPSLQRLTIYEGQEVGGYVINAPSLKYLEIEGFDSHKFCLIENAPELVEAKIVNVSDIINENILGSLTSAKRLCLELSPLKITFPMGSIFYQLVYLELYTHKAEWWNLLLLMLNASPRLQVLKLIGRWYCDKDRVACEKLDQRKNVSECMLLNLETFVWHGYKQQLEEEKEVAKYILRNANRLNRATVSIEGVTSDERLEMLEELESVVRASNSSCQLLLLE